MKKVVAIMLAVILVAFSVVSVFAVQSPGGKFKYKVVVVPTEGGYGTYEFTSEIDENAEQGVRLYPIPYDGYTFHHWEIRGLFRNDPYGFDIVHLGAVSLNTSLLAAVSSAASGVEYGTMDMMIHSDIYAYPYYLKDGKVAGGVATKDTSPVSPQTGANDVLPYVVIALSVVAVGTAVALFVKSSRRKSN